MRWRQTLVIPRPVCRVWVWARLGGSLLDGGGEGSGEVLELVDPRRPDSGGHQDADQHEQGAAGDIEGAHVAAHEAQCSADPAQASGDEDEG